MPITFKEIEVVDNGAQFFNADLHVHSFGGSHDVKDPTMTVEAIIDAAVKMGIRLLAITDHNNDANVAKALDHAQKYTGQLLFLPGVEITTAHGHLLVYFPPQQAEQLRHLLGKINLRGTMGDADSHTAMSMADVIREAELLGGISIAAHIDRQKTGFETAVAGYPNWKKDIITSSGLYALELDSPANLAWFSDDDLSTNEGSARKQVMMTRAKLPATASRPQLGHVQGSDSHSLANFTAGSATKILTRFKLNELSYDAFRTALADPQARVRAVASIPKLLPRVLGMHVTGGFLDGATYHFSDNLNCFIGGRGTGKSSALQTLAYGLGLDDDLEEHGNCPGTVIIYCEDMNGVRYRYERIQGATPIVRAREDNSVTEVPVDAFRVEYYRQGELAEVAKNPLKNPTLLQEFLDRHLILSDLLAKEELLAAALAQNSGQLIPLEGNAGQLVGKKRAVDEIDKKLKIAETGNLKEIASDQTRLGNEKNLSKALAEVAKDYSLGITLKNFLRDYADIEAECGQLSGTPESQVGLAKIKAAVSSANTTLKEKEKEINATLKLEAAEITKALGELKALHVLGEQQLNVRITGLQKKGLTGNVAELQTLIRQKSALVQEITTINNQKEQLNQLRADRAKFISELSAARDEITTRRKAQLASINANLAATIQDYTVFVHYEPSGIIDEFRNFILEKMQGTYFQEALAEKVCSRMNPADLASLVLAEDFVGIAATTGVEEDWARRICENLRFFTELHSLEVMWKAPCPVITVRTKALKPREILVHQLSDGQKHTIMLTIAMLAESNIPLVIDQPEDDLDNSFIFSTVVKTLRAIKERRQVILVTHNANIAVLGDAEMLLPMKRSGDGGASFDCGSIDKAETKQAVVTILEGGDIAFQRRKEIYGY